MMATLLWQTWHESRKRLPIPIVVAVVLLVATGLFSYLITRPQLATLSSAATLFFAPALYGALTFSADQRRGSYRFLAEHAAGSRYVWLARHIAWLGAVVTLSAVVATVIVGVIAVAIRISTAESIDDYLRRGYWGFSHAPYMAFELERGIRYGIQAAGLAWWGVLAAYGIGQFCSILIRSEIMAAFTALVISVLLSGWVATLFVWQLAGSVFLLPLILGSMLATWLRAPAWIAERQTWRSWWQPMLAIGACLTFVGALLPAARLAQLPLSLGGQNPQSAMANQLNSFRQGDSPAARETAAMCLRAANLLDSWRNNDLFDRWNKPEYMQAVGGEGYIGGLGDRMGEEGNPYGASFGIDVSNIPEDERGDFQKMGGPGGGMGEEGGPYRAWFGIDVSKIPADERSEFQRAVREQLGLEAKANGAAVKLAIEASRRPSCRFDFNFDQALPMRGNQLRQWDLGSIPDYERLKRLLLHLRLYRTSAEESLTPKLAALRMSAHIRSGQPSPIFLDQLREEQQTLQEIGEWALETDRTDEQLRAAIGQLSEHFRMAFLGRDSTLLADHLLVRDTLTDKLYPLSLSEETEVGPVYWAYLANQLGWERERGLRALDLITLQNIADTGHLLVELTRQSHMQDASRRTRRWLQPLPDGLGLTPLWEYEQPAAATSYLTRFEYQARVQVYDLHRAICDAETHRRATLIKIALAAYRRDHHTYPNSLAELVPDYLDHEPFDPYSSQPFHFVPTGLELPLRYTRYIGYSIVNPGDVSPGTPLFWSVGAADSQLQRIQFPRLVPKEDRTVDETVYVLVGDSTAAWSQPPLVFPLPD